MFNMRPVCVVLVFAERPYKVEDFSRRAPATTLGSSCCINQSSCPLHSGSFSKSNGEIFGIDPTSHWTHSILPKKAWSLSNPLGRMKEVVTSDCFGNF
eukprot:scaffold251321_cov152-Cyclotella_meneghiniana.AAC.1